MSGYKSFAIFGAGNVATPVIEVRIPSTTYAVPPLTSVQSTTGTDSHPRHLRPRRPPHRRHPPPTPIQHQIRHRRLHRQRRAHLPPQRTRDRGRRIPRRQRRAAVAEGARARGEGGGHGAAIRAERVRYAERGPDGCVCGKEGGCHRYLLTLPARPV